MTGIRWGEDVEATKAHAYAVEADDTPTRRRSRAQGINPGTPQTRSLCRRWTWYDGVTVNALTDEEVAAMNPDYVCATCRRKAAAR